MSQLQPACHGKFITNEYFLSVRAGMDGMICCADTPVTKIPLFVVPIVNPNCFGLTAPADFKPQMQAPAKITLISHKLMNYCSK